MGDLVKTIGCCGRVAPGGIKVARRTEVDSSCSVREQPEADRLHLSQ